MLIIAPGNYARSDVLAHGILSIMYRGHGQVNAWCNWLMLPNIMLLFSFLVLYKRRIDIPFKSIIFTGWAWGSILIMVLSPSYPQRATFGSFVLILVAVFSNLCSYLEKEPDNCLIMRLFSIVLWMGMLGTFLSIIILAGVRNMGVYIPG